MTTGQLLCACVGSAIRSEYTVYGNAINLSARLMTKAAGGAGCVLCDSNTYQLAQKAVAFTTLQPLEVLKTPEGHQMSPKQPQVSCDYLYTEAASGRIVSGSCHAHVRLLWA